WPGCGAWPGVVEEAVRDVRKRSERGAPASAAPRSIAACTAGETLRRSTGLGELDRVLGGGLVQGSVVLIGGDPGIGKSTLALQACGALARQGLPVLYVAGEESPEQVRLRAERLGMTAAGVGDVQVLPEAAAGRSARTGRCGARSASRARCGPSAAPTCGCARRRGRGSAAACCRRRTPAASRLPTASRPRGSGRSTSSSTCWGSDDLPGAL